MQQVKSTCLKLKILKQMKHFVWNMLLAMLFQLPLCHKNSEVFHKFFSCWFFFFFLHE
jgi:hypothetical protein